MRDLHTCKLYFWSCFAERPDLLIPSTIPKGNNSKQEIIRTWKLLWQDHKSLCTTHGLPALATRERDSNRLLQAPALQSCLVEHPRGRVLFMIHKMIPQIKKILRSKSCDRLYWNDDIFRWMCITGQNPVMTHRSKLKQIEKVLGWIIDTPYIW